MGKQITVDEEKLDKLVDAYVEAVFKLAKLQNRLKTKQKPKYDWVDHVSGFSLIDKIFD